MKLAVISDEVSQDFERVLAFAEDFALDGVEIRSVWDKPPHKLSDAEVERIGAAMRDAGLQVCGVATPTLKCDVHNAQEVAEHVGILQRCVELAQLWNAPLIRVFTGWRTREPRNEYSHVAGLFRDKLLPQVEGKNLTLGVENEYSTNVAGGDEVVTFFQALSAPQTTLVWDPCNVLPLPQRSDSLREDYPKVRELIGHFHVKDAVRVGDGRGAHSGELSIEHVAIGDGEVHIRGHLQALHRDGYDGWVSLETHWRLNKLLSEKEANLPQGRDFSQGAEPASRECMRRLKEWVGALQ